MSTKTGTATDYLDCLNQLRTFLTTDSTLVSLGQNWTELATNSTPYTVTDNGQTNTVDFESYMKAPGLSGSESIYVNFQAYHNVTADIYNWRIKGAIGFIALGGSNTFFTQPNCSPDAYLPMWNESLTYWFIANGERVIVVVKIATVYESGYFGKFLPYGTSGQYPYPLAIGGASGGVNEGVPGWAGANIRYSDVSANHACFFDPFNLLWLDPSNVWRTICNFVSGTHASGSGEDSTWPYWYADNSNIGFLETNLDGSYPLFAVRLTIGGSGGAPINELGELDGVFATIGYGASSESIISAGGNTYTMFQNAFRTSKENYVALLWA